MLYLNFGRIRGGQAIVKNPRWGRITKSSFYPSPILQLGIGNQIKQLLLRLRHTEGFEPEKVWFLHFPIPDFGGGQFALNHSLKPYFFPITSMNPRVIYTEQAPQPVGPYSQAIVATGQLVFVAGQIPLHPLTGELVGENNITHQTQQVMSNLSAILTAAGTSFAKVVKTTVYLKDLQDFAAMNEVYSHYFNAESAPARATVQVARLPKDVMVEIDCIAVI